MDFTLTDEHRALQQMARDLKIKKTFFIANKQNNPDFPNGVILDFPDPLEKMAYEYLLINSVPSNLISEWFEEHNNLIMKIYYQLLEKK